MEARHPPGCYGTDSVFTSTLMAGKCEAQVMSLLETAKRNCLRLHTLSLTRTKNISRWISRNITLITMFRHRRH